MHHSALIELVFHLFFKQKLEMVEPIKSATTSVMLGLWSFDQTSCSSLQSRTTSLSTSTTNSKHGSELLQHSERQEVWLSPQPNLLDVLVGKVWRLWHCLNLWCLTQHTSSPDPLKCVCFHVSITVIRFTRGIQVPQACCKVHCVWCMGERPTTWGCCSIF